MAACRAAHEAEALEEVQTCEMAGGRPHTIREEAGSGAMVAARSRLPSTVSLPVRDVSVRAMVDCGVGAVKLAVGVGVAAGDRVAAAVALGVRVACADVEGSAVTDMVAVPEAVADALAEAVAIDVDEVVDVGV